LFLGSEILKLLLVSFCFLVSLLVCAHETAASLIPLSVWRNS
jgi:hypothetical protein